MSTKHHSYFYPTRIEYGPGVVQNLPPIVRETGVKRGLLVTDKGLSQTGIPLKIIAYFQSAGLELIPFDNVQSNPTEANVLEGTTLYKESKAEFIVALGGGSPMDVAKTIKVMATHEGPLAQYDDTLGGDKLIRNNMPPLYCIPTTAGTGSEVGRSSVITIGNKKTIIFSPFMMPGVAVLDPELTLGLPPKLTAATGMDAFVHNLEAYWVESFHPFADGIAWEGMRLCYENLTTVVKRGGNLEARGKMLMASAMGATAFQKGLGLIHSIAHPLGVYYNIHHGTTNAALLIGVSKFNIEHEPARKKLAAIGPLLGTKNNAEAVIQKMEVWLREIDMPVDLKLFNISPHDLQKIEDYALTDPTLPTNSRPVQKGDVMRLLETLI